MPQVSPPPSDSLPVSFSGESATTHRKCAPVSRTPPFNSPLLRHTAVVDPSCSNSTTVSKKKRRDPNYIPRPPNCFFLFRKHFIANLPEGYVHPTKTKSKLAGEAWRALPASEKQKWAKRAHEVSVEHAKKYPNWKYSPIRKSDKRRRAGQIPTSKHRVGVVTPPPPSCGQPPSIPEGGLNKGGPAPSSSQPHSRMPPPNYNLSYPGDRPEAVPADLSATAHLLSHRDSPKTSFQAPPSHGDEFAHIFEGHQVACIPKDIPHHEIESSNHPSQRYEDPHYVTPISQTSRGYGVSKLNAWKTMSGHDVISTSPPNITSTSPVPMGSHANSTSPVHVHPAVPSDELQEQALTMPDSLDISFIRFGASQLDANLHADAGCIVHGATSKPLTTPDELFLVGKPQSDSLPPSSDLTQQSGELYLSGLDGLDGADAVVDPQHQDGEEDSLLGLSFSMPSQEELHDFFESMPSFCSSYPCSDSPLD